MNNHKSLLAIASPVVALLVIAVTALIDSGRLLAALPSRGDLPPERIIDLGDGRFQIALDPEIGTEPPDSLNGVVEWQYAGQAVYVWADKAQPHRNGGPRELENDEPLDTVTRLLDSEMEDQYGRRFVAKSVDLERLEGMIAEYNKRVGKLYGPEPTQGKSPDADDPESRFGELFPLAWYAEDQSGDGLDDLNRWDSDDRLIVSEPLTTRQEKTVMTWREGSEGGLGSSCSGTLVGEYWTLSAFHCHKDAAGDWIYPRGYVCTGGAGTYPNGDCGTITGRWGLASWNSSGSDPGQDITILRIADNLGSGGNWMPLSQANNAVLKDYTNYHIGYPGFTPSGVENDGSLCYFDGGIFEWMKCRSMYWSADEVNYTSTKIIGTHIDVAAGQSGGPIFYYPAGVCPTCSHFLTGVMGGHFNGLFHRYNGGPKIPYHRDWVLGIID